MAVDTTLQPVVVVSCRCRRCGRGFAHYRPEIDAEACASTLCVCAGCGRLYRLSLWEDAPTHEALRTIHKRSHGDAGTEAAMLGGLLPRCECGSSIGVYDDRCPACGSRNQQTLAVSRETRPIVPVTLACGAQPPAGPASIARLPALDSRPRAN